MKMEIEVKAPKAGTIQSIAVAQGDKVVTGQALAVIGYKEGGKELWI